MRAAWFSGAVRARHESQLGFRVGGKIERRLVDNGARVEAGQVLAMLDPRDLRLALTASQATVSAARADAELAQAEHERAQAVLARGLISRSQFDAQQTALTSARARLEQAQAQWTVDRNQLSYAELRADRAGTVTSITAEAGQVVVAGQAIAVLAQEGEREIEIALPEGDLSRYPVGMQAKVALWSTPDRQYASEIREIAADADSASRTYRARVRLLDQDANVQLGMTARVRFDDDDETRLLSLPLTALHAKDEKPAVWLVDRATGQVSLHPVEIAAYREAAVDVSGGLTGNDLVVVAGVHKLHEGQVVRPVDRDNQPVVVR
jgi:multidrug efflux system membrane fusion protein